MNKRAKYAFIIASLIFTSPTYGEDWLDQLSNKNRVIDQKKQQRDREFERDFVLDLVKIINICGRLETNYEFSRRAKTQLSRILRSDPSTIKIQNIELRLDPTSCIGVFTYPRGTAFCQINTSTVSEGNIINSFGRCQ